MKKPFLHLFNFVLLFTCYSLLVTDYVNAGFLDVNPPILPNKTLRKPATSGSLETTFPNYNPNDATQDTDVNVCVNNFVISQTFDPKFEEQTVVVTNPDGTTRTETQREAIPYQVDKLEQAKSLNLPLSNTQNRVWFHSFTNTTEICADPQTAKQNSRYYDLKVGTNVADRITRLDKQSCFRGQRMVKTALSLSTKFPLPDNTANDQPIAYDHGSTCSSQRENDSPILLSQVINQLKDNPIFYNPTIPCDSQNIPNTLFGIIDSIVPSAFANDVRSELATKGGTRFAQTIYNNLPMSGTGSTEELITIINIGRDGLAMTPTHIPQSVAANSVNDKTVEQFIKTGIDPRQKIPKSDPCASGTDNSIFDEKAPVSFVAQVLDYINKVDNWVRDTARTFTDSRVVVKQTVPAQKQRNVDAAEVSYRNQLRPTSQKVYDSVPVNSTSNPGITTDSGYRSSSVFRSSMKQYYRPEQIQKYRL